MSATAGMTVVGSRTSMTYSGGQVTQIGVDGTLAHQPVIGTCQNCGQTNIRLHSHMGPQGVRYVCLAAGTQAPYIMPPAPATGTKITGAAPHKGR